MIESNNSKSVEYISRKDKSGFSGWGTNGIVRNTREKVYRAYIEIMERELLNGYTWTLPKNIAKIFVVKIYAGIDNRLLAAKHLHGNRDNFKVINNINGFSFVMDMTGKLKEKCFIDIMISRKFREKVTERVLAGQQYRFDKNLKPSIYRSNGN